ncbi:MAG TPA: DoxX family protein [Pseudolabrys sp.]|nr:DoxX family protein [Pseudolabrys sp.]
MTDITTGTQSPLAEHDGEEAMASLADRLTALAPTAAEFSPRPIVFPSLGVRAALTTGAAIVKRADERARRSRSIIGTIIDSFVSACSFIPYAVVALALRLTMARVFFFDGQGLIEGPRYALSYGDFNLSAMLPLGIKAEAIAALSAHNPVLPLPGALTAYGLGYAEFILPIMLILGFGARFAALGLIGVTAIIQLYAAPELLWSVHIYWIAILAVLLTLGPGQISFDYIIRLIAKR